MHFQYAKTTAVLVFLLLINNIAFSQDEKRDTTINSIYPVDIKAYFTSQPILTSTSSAKVITQQQIQSQYSATLLSAMNSTPGIRMEERSPGSYRIAMRGSLIRSPFGVRNIKVYLDEIPFTDAGGNTYFNSLDPVGIQQIQVIKGPDGSLYGPNTGGVISITPNGFGATKNETSINLNAGSYGTFHQQFSTNYQVNDNYKFSFDQAFLRSDGYREQTALNKKYFQTAHQWDYNPKGNLKAFVLYSDLMYQTPGGLTLAQYQEDPKMARPAAGPNPGAIEQQAAIYNKTFLAGLTNTYQLNQSFSHSITLFGTITDFENPFISNYEFRDEKNMGFRTYFTYHHTSSNDLRLEMQLGAEGQKGWYAIRNFDNHKGTPGDSQAEDDLTNGQHFYFYRTQVKLKDKLTLEGSIGLNFNSIAYTKLFPVVSNPSGNLDFDPQWMPRLAASYALTKQMAVRASYSKGFSTPTISEVRSSDNNLNTNLNPESGSNYEIGYRFETKNRRLIADISAYTYQLNDGIVRQLTDSGAEYFVNAGIIDQKGVELMIFGQLISNSSGFIKNLSLSSNTTYQDYVFDAYLVDEKDFTGNAVTSVPKWMFTHSLSAAFPKNFGLNLQHNFTSRIPLDDANTVFADDYHLMQAKAFWNTNLSSKYRIQIYAGVDNLLNETYSLGNDINAFGGRYYNASMPRNYYLGIKITR